MNGAPVKTLLALALTLGVPTLAAQQDARARILIDRGCSDCHGVVVLKVKGKADVGPDLSAAYVDVPFRYGMTLERFFDQTPGIMRIVLGGRPSLRRAERDSLVMLFRTLYTDQLAKLDSAQRQLRPVEAKHRSKEEALAGLFQAQLGVVHVVEFGAASSILPLSLDLDALEDRSREALERLVERVIL